MIVGIHACAKTISDMPFHHSPARYGQAVLECVGALPILIPPLTSWRNQPVRSSRNNDLTSLPFVIPSEASESAVFLITHRIVIPRACDFFGGDKSLLRSAAWFKQISPAGGG